VSDRPSWFICLRPDDQRDATIQIEKIGGVHPLFIVYPFVTLAEKE